MITLTQLDTTYVGQLNKPENKKMLEDTVASGDKSPKAFSNYYFKLVEALAGTPAWGKPKTNAMINDLTSKVIASITKSKKGKSSSVSHANTMLGKIEWCSKSEAKGTYWQPEALNPILTKEEVEKLLSQYNT